MTYLRLAIIIYERNSWFIQESIRHSLLAVLAFGIFMVGVNPVKSLASAC
jgi:hypothetical protein